jgi:4-hydroxy-tetrahydrodipicolinate reductase
MNKVRIAVHGATGRMGLAVVRAVLARADTELTAALVRPGSRFEGEPLSRLLGAAAPDLDFVSALDPDVVVDVLIDFSAAESFDAGLALARARRCAFVSGTTGLDEAEQAALDAAAADIPVLWAANFSLGIAVMAHLAAEAVRKLGPEFDVEVVEIHHRDKRDAPSGTAIQLAAAVADARQAALMDVARFGRHGASAARAPQEIGVAALRGGDAVGEHTVLLLGDGERLELSHRVSDRGIFARGAVAAAAWIRGQPAGRYGMAALFAEPSD